MRLRLLLEAHQPITIPWNYRTDLTKAVYMTLNTADPDYATRLRDHGFSWKNRIYRLFVYSDLTPVHWSLSSHGLADVRWMTWQIGSPDQQFMDAFIKGIERQAGKLHIFGTLIEVVDIVRIDPPELGDGLVFRTVSPIAVSVGDPSRSRHPIYLRPISLNSSKLSGVISSRSGRLSTSENGTAESSISASGIRSKSSFACSIRTCAHGICIFRCGVMRD